MVETFYGTKLDEQVAEKNEYYTLTCIPVPQESFIVSQVHGWWDTDSDCSKCAELVLATVGFLCPINSGTVRMLTPAIISRLANVEEEARRIYEEQRAKIIALGFIYLRCGLLTIPAPASARGLIEA